MLTGQLKAGDRLLPERQLADALAVGRPMVREALRSLAALGAVDIRRGYGTVVREPDFTALAEYFSFVLAQQTAMADDILQARIAVERQAVRLACARASVADTRKIAGSLEQIRDTLSSPVQCCAADHDFHATIVEAARSPTLSSIYAAVARVLEQSNSDRGKSIASGTRLDSRLVDHLEAVLRAIERRDAAEADRLIAEHFGIIAADPGRYPRVVSSVRSTIRG